jgi:5'-nucleotidase
MNVCRARGLRARIWARAAVGLALATSSILALARGHADEPRDPWVHLVVVHTNDVHGNLLPRTPALAMVEADGPVGGFAALASFVRAERAAAQAAGAHVLLLDGGDVWRGTPEGDLTKGDLVVEAFSRLHYDAVAVGNHEFDFGVDNAARLARASGFPWISANVTEKATGARPAWLRASVVLEVDGVRVGIVGMTPPDTPKLVMGGDRLPLAFGDEVEAAKAEAKALEGRADVVVFLTHLGPERDRRILDALPSVPLVVGGHSHTRLAKPIPSGPDGRAWVVQAGTACVVVGRVRMTVHRETHEVVLEEAGLTPLIVAKVGSDAETAKFLDERLGSDPVLKALGETVATLASDLPREGASPEASSPAGNAFADAMRAAAGTLDGQAADVALANRGGIRVRLPKGPVTGRDLHLLMPFENTLVLVTLKGAELRAVIEASLRPSTRISPLEVSGLAARWKRTGEGAASKVTFTSFEVGGKPLDEARTYRVIVNSFLAQGGDGYGGLANRPGARDLGILVRDALRRFLGATPVFVPDATERLRPD